MSTLSTKHVAFYWRSSCHDWWNRLATLVVSYSLCMYACLWLAVPCRKRNPKADTAMPYKAGYEEDIFLQVKK